MDHLKGRRPALSIMAGMRVGEIAALKVGDVRGLDGKAVEIVHLTKHQTKGNRSRRVFVGDDLMKLLNAYLIKRAKLGDQAPLIQLVINDGLHKGDIALHWQWTLC